MGSRHNPRHLPSHPLHRTLAHTPGNADRIRSHRRQRIRKDSTGYRLVRRQPRRLQRPPAQSRRMAIQKRHQTTRPTPDRPLHRQQFPKKHLQQDRPHRPGQGRAAHPLHTRVSAGLRRPLGPQKHRRLLPHELATPQPPRQRPLRQNRRPRLPLLPQARSRPHPHHRTQVPPHPQRKPSLPQATGIHRPDRANQRTRQQQPKTRKRFQARPFHAVQKVGNPHRHHAGPRRRFSDRRPGD